MSQLNLDNIFKRYLENKTVFKDKHILTDQYIPSTILHREDKINQIATTAAPALRGEKISNMFIFGTVGTGKSVSVKYVMSELEKNSEKVRVIFINCKMKKVSDTEYRLLAEMARSLGCNVPSTGLPTDEIYKIFFESIDENEQSVILVLDEIDALVNKTGDEILYNLTRINQDLKNAKLSIIGISNDVSFTDNLDPRVKSSLSEEEIIFQPYNAHQLQDILIQRAALAFNDDAVDQGVISKCAALAAQEHGDARKALDLLRISGEIVEREGGERVDIEYVDKAENKLDVDKTTEIVKSQPKQSQVVLGAIIKLMENGDEKIQTGEVFSVYEEMCKASGLKLLTQRRVTDLIGELDMLGIINARVISKGRYGRTREIRMLLGKPIIEKIRFILKDNFVLD
jgi:cell division control protein 6